MLSHRLVTLQMVSVSMPRMTTPSRLLVLPTITSPCTYGVAATTPGTRVASRVARQPVKVPCGTSTTTCAWLPRILSLRSLRKPPMTLRTTHSMQVESVTAMMLSVAMNARKPLFLARRCRAATSARKSRLSTRRSSGWVMRATQRASAQVAPAKRAMPSTSCWSPGGMGRLKKDHTMTPASATPTALRDKSATSRSLSRRAKLTTTNNSAAPPMA